MVPTTDPDGRSQMTRVVATLGHVVIDDVLLADGSRLPAALGGAGTYAVLGQALVTPRTAVVSGVGADFPASARQTFQRAGTDTTGLVALDPHTPRTRIEYFADGERVETPTFGLEHFERLDPRVEMLPAPSRDLAGVYVFDAINPVAWHELRALRARTGCAVLWEIHAGICTPENLQAVVDQLADVDVLSLNRTEARGLCGADDLDTCLQILTSTGVPVIALRLGAEGAAVIGGATALRAAPPVGPVVDPTGAGNAFSGAFLASWALAARSAEEQRRTALVTALRAAMAASALTIRQYGPPLVNPPLRDEHHRLAAAIDVVPIDDRTTRQNGILL